MNRKRALELASLNWAGIRRGLALGNQELAQAVRVLHGFDISDALDRALSVVRKQIRAGTVISDKTYIAFIEKTMEQAELEHVRLFNRAVAELERI